MSTQKLPPPPAASAARSAQEIARVWVADGNLHVSLATEVWSDPAAWGLVLVDIARHVARSYAHTSGLEESEAFSRIMAGFEAEASSPTDDLHNPPAS